MPGLPIAGPVLGLDVGDVAGIVVFVLMLLSLLARVISERAQAAPPPANAGQRPRAFPGEDRLDDEIDQFLQEVAGRRGSDDVPIEIVPPPQPGKRPPPARPTQKRPPKPAPAPPKEQPAKARLGSGITERRGPGSTNLGSGVRSHLSTYMEENRVEKEVAQRLGHSVDESVQAHLGQLDAPKRSRTAEGGELQQKPASGTLNIVSLLRDPSGVRQAILLNEILARPRSLQKRP